MVQEVKKNLLAKTMMSKAIRIKFGLNHGVKRHSPLSSKVDLSRGEHSEAIIKKMTFKSNESSSEERPA